MTLIRSMVALAVTVAEYHLNRWGRETRTETGAMSTEAVALAAGLVLIAIGLVAVLRSKATAIVESIPETGFGGDG